MSKNLHEEILKVANSNQQIDEASFAEFAKRSAESAAGRVTAAALLANPVGGVETRPATPSTTMTVPAGSVDVERETIISVPHSVEKTKTVPFPNFVSTQPIPGTPAVPAQNVTHHGTFEFTGEAHPLHGTPVMKDGKIKSGSDTFKVNTETGETHRLQPTGQWNQVSHSAYSAPTRDQIKERSVPGSVTHDKISELEQKDSLQSKPAQEAVPGVPSRVVAVPGTRDVKTKETQSILQAIKSVTSVPRNETMNIPGSPASLSTFPRSDEYIDTSKPIGLTREPEVKKEKPKPQPITPSMEEPKPQPITPSMEEPKQEPSSVSTTSDVIRMNSGNRDSSGRLRGSTPVPVTPPTPIPPPATPLVRAYEPGRVRFGQRGAVANVIGGVPVYSTPQQGPLVPGPNQRRIIRSHYETQGENMLSENNWKNKDREDTKKLKPGQRAKKKRISAALEKDPRFKKKYGNRSDEVRSRIANKVAQKDESYNPYKERLYSLLENKIIVESFIEDVIKSVRTHVKDPDKTVRSERGDDFDTFDIARDLAGAIERHMSQPKEQRDSRFLERKISGLKSILPDEHVAELISKHFKD